MGWTVAAAAAFACGVPRYLGKCTHADPGSNVLLCSKPVGLHSLQGRTNGDTPVADYPHCAQSALWSQSSLNPSSHSLTCSYPLSPTPSLQSSQQREQVEPHFRRNVVFFPQKPPTPTPPRSHGPAQESNGEPVWYHPAAQTLGPMLCRQGDPQPPARVCALPCPCPSSPTPSHPCHSQATVV